MSDIARLEKPSEAARTQRLDEAAAPAAFAGGPPPVAGVAGRRPAPGSGPEAGKGTFSIIGNDLTIIGHGLRIVTKGTLQVDGLVEGDVVGNEVIIGELGRVTGVVTGHSVEIRGEVSGTIKGMSVVLRSGARVEGDVHHRELTVDQGAHLDGRVRRPQDDAELKPVLD